MAFEGDDNIARLVARHRMVALPRPFHSRSLRPVMPMRRREPVATCLVANSYENYSQVTGALYGTGLQVLAAGGEVLAVGRSAAAGPA